MQKNGLFDEEKQEKLKKTVIMHNTGAGKKREKTHGEKCAKY